MSKKKVEKVDKVVLTIVIPVRNNCTSLLRMLHELKEQGKGFGNEYRVLVVDDASEDETKLVLPKLQEELNFVYNRPWEERRGAGAARNHGGNVASILGTDYIAFFDADDFLHNRALSMILAACSNGRDQVIWGFSVICPDKHNNRSWLPAFGKNPDDWHNTPVAPWLHAIRPHLLAKFPEHILTDDVIWWIRQANILKMTKATTEFIVAPLYVYDKTQGGCTRAHEWFEKNPTTLEAAAVNNVCEAHGFPDRYVSDCIRNLAEMYDLRHEIGDEGVRQLWLNRFRSEITSLMVGKYGW